MNMLVKLDACQQMATETGNRLVIHFIPDDGWHARCGVYAASHPDLMLTLDTMLKQRDRFNKNPPIEEIPA